MKHSRTIYHTLQQITALAIMVSLNVAMPAATYAQDATGSSTVADSTTTSCTGTSCTQGQNQGANQGTNQGTNLGVEANNTNTGSDSDNQNNVDANSSTTNDVDNTSSTTTDAAATANSGGNTSSDNTGDMAIDTGDAGIGVTQVINDNTTTIGGTAGLQVSGYNGDYNGDLNLDFGAGTANLANTDGGGSVKATNETTGSDSTNNASVTTTTEQINEIQNDGVIDNLLDLAAITGQNEADRNTGDAVITTGDANVAATLVNLLNTTVINGDLWITVADIFGDLNGNINIPDLAAWLSSYGSGLAVDAGNANTGADSTNTVNVGLTDTETTTVNNNADIDTIVNASAITGQNDSLRNTGGAVVDTGDATVSASNVSLANTTIEGGNWGIFIVNALNGWLGFLVGDGGQVQALSPDETLQHIQAQNNNTGSDSENTIDVDHTNTVTDTVLNDAEITNEINATAITGQNETADNTGAGMIGTGNANIQATTVNIANTTVKNGSLFVAVVNVFGDWFGDLLYGGKSLAANANPSSTNVAVDATNGTTGSDSTNEVNVDYDRDQTTRINNDADIATTLNANIDTGSNNANRNTGAARVTTGDGLLALHARSAANLTGIAELGGLGISINGLNETTGENSQNRIRATINDDRVIAVNNEANISTVIGSANNPATVNTGGNNANMNTLGALIETGSASADVAIQNVVNQVLIALAGRGVNVDADFANQLTGALSTNTGDLTVTQRTILDIINRGVIDNIINLILNTGGNNANDNTGEVAISTGAGCVELNVDNDLNRTNKGLKQAVSGTQIVNAAGSNNTTGFDSTNTTNTTVQQTGTLNVTNDGQINNTADVDATTGNNEQNDNTGGAANNPAAGECPKVAVAASPTPAPTSPTPTPSGGGDQPEGNGGDNGDQGSDHQGVGGGEARVAGVTDDKQPTIAPAKKGLMRFPVAGGEAYAKLLQGKKRLPWQLFVIASMGVLAAAWSFDRKSHAAQLGRLP